MSGRNGMIPTARALLSDPAALEPYRAEAAALEHPTVDAVAWFVDTEPPTAVLLSVGAASPFALGMPVGYQRLPGGSGAGEKVNEEDFPLTLEIARDARFALVGRAVQEDQFGLVDGRPLPAGTVSYESACGSG